MEAKAKMIKDKNDQHKKKIFAFVSCFIRCEWDLIVHAVNFHMSSIDAQGVKFLT